jgi:hypothetical protein
VAKTSDNRNVRERERERERERDERYQNAGICTDIMHACMHIISIYL